MHLHYLSCSIYETLFCRFDIKIPSRIIKQVKYISIVTFKTIITANFGHIILHGKNNRNFCFYISPKDNY